MTMNPSQKQIVRTSDPFRAAWLLTRCARLKGLKRSGESERIYIVEGESAEEEDMDYRCGRASVNPLVLREAFYLLQELSGSSDDDDLPEEEELDLFADDIED